MTLQNNITRQHKETQNIIVPYKTNIIILQNNITRQKIALQHIKQQYNTIKQRY